MGFFRSKPSKEQVVDNNVNNNVDNNANNPSNPSKPSKPSKQKKQKPPKPIVVLTKVPFYIDADLVIALPGGGGGGGGGGNGGNGASGTHRFQEVEMNFKLKGARFKKPLEPLPEQFFEPLPLPLPLPLPGPGRLGQGSFVSGQEYGHGHSSLGNRNPFKDIQSLQPLQPPPPPPQQQQHAKFKPFAIYSKTDELSDGFLPFYPTIFSTDPTISISIPSWTRFIEDMISVARRIPKRRQIMAGLNLSADNFNYQLYKYWMKEYGRMQYPLVKELVETWNQRYFRPRGILVVFQEPEEIWNVRAVQEVDQGYVRPKERSSWDALKINQMKVITQDKVRILVFSL